MENVKELIENLAEVVIVALYVSFVVALASFGVASVIWFVVFAFELMSREHSLFSVFWNLPFLAFVVSFVMCFVFSICKLWREP